MDQTASSCSLSLALSLSLFSLPLPLFRAEIPVSVTFVFASLHRLFIWSFQLLYALFTFLFPPLSVLLLLLSFSVSRTSGAKYNRMWYAALAFVTLMLFTAAVGAVAFMGLFYTDPEACLLNKVFLGINGSLCLIVSMLAISPCIQKRKQQMQAQAFAIEMSLSDALRFFHLIPVVAEVTCSNCVPAVQPTSGLLQPGVISVYVMYLTFSAFTSKPAECKKTPIRPTSCQSCHWSDSSFYSCQVVGFNLKFRKHNSFVWAHNHWQQERNAHCRADVAAVTAFH